MSKKFIKTYDSSYFQFHLDLLVINVIKKNTYRFGKFFKKNVTLNNTDNLSEEIKITQKILNNSTKQISEKNSPY